MDNKVNFGQSPTDAIIAIAPWLYVFRNVWNWKEAPIKNLDISLPARS